MVNIIFSKTAESGIYTFDVENSEESSRSPGCSIAWSKNPPNEQADWWWWNEDEDSSPILVSILASCSGTGDRFFASVGQHGWNRPQWVEDMGGWWMKALIPEPPKQ